jgi:prolipoprotein diacylglyceryltransferase
MIAQTIGVGSWQVNTLTALVALGMALSLALDQVGARRDWAERLASTAATAAIALICARMAFVALQWPYFSEHRGAILALNNTPGLSAHGAVIGALLASAASRGRLTPPALTPLLLGAAVALGCIPNGCLFGRELFWRDSLWPLAVDWPDATLIRNPRLPVQPALALWCVICAVAVPRLARRVKSPQTLFYGAAGLAVAGDFFVQFWRGDEARYWAGFRLEQWLDVAILCASLSLTFIAISSRKKPT